MKPAWDKVMKEFDGHKTIVVADVDCTAAGKDLCTEVGVKGYPTIKHGDPSALEDYKGGRDYDALKKFADNLKPSCSPANIDLCDDDKKKQIAELQALSSSELTAKIAEKEKEITSLEADFKKAVEKLQAEYTKLNTEKDAAVAAVKSSGLGLMKAVNAAAKKKKQEL